MQLPHHLVSHLSFEAPVNAGSPGGGLLIISSTRSGAASRASLDVGSWPGMAFGRAVQILTLVDRFVLGGDLVSEKNLEVYVTGGERLIE